MKLKASVSRTIEQVNQWNDSGRMAAGFNEAESGIDILFNQFNTMNISIDNILDSLSRIMDKEMNQGFFDGSIPSVFYNSGAMLRCVQKDDLFISTLEQSHKVFRIPIGYMKPVSYYTLLYHQVQELERMIHMVPKIVNNSLLSIGKFSDVKYVSIFNEDQVDMYDINGRLITVSKQ